MSSQKSMQWLMTFPKEFPPVTSGVLTLNCNELFTGHSNGFVVHWNIKTAKYRIIQQYSSSVESMQLSKDGDILVGCKNGTLAKFLDKEPYNSETLMNLGPAKRYRVWKAAFLSKERIVISSTYGGIRELCKNEHGWNITPLQSRHSNSIFGLGVTDGFFALGDYRGQISVWDFRGDEPKVVQYLGVGGSVEDIAWREDGAFSTINSSGGIDFFERTESEGWKNVLKTDIAESFGNCIHFTDDGKNIYAGTATNIIQIETDSQNVQFIELENSKAIFSKGHTIFALNSRGLVSFDEEPVQLPEDMISYHYSKVSLIGRTGTGKTSLCSLIVNGSTEGIKSTFNKRIWDWHTRSDAQFPVRLMLHDHGGQESLLDTFLPFLVDSDVVLLFFKQTDLESYEKAASLLEEIRSVIPTNTKIMMVETFIDHDIDEINEADIRELVRKGQIEGIMKVCPITGQGVDKFKSELIRLVPWNKSKVMFQSKFVEDLNDTLSYLNSEGATSMTFAELKKYYENKRPISSNHLRFLLENASIQGKIEYYPKAGNIIVFNDEKYNKLRTEMPIYVEHKKGLVTISDLLAKFKNDTYVKMLDSVYLSYGICFENGNLRIFPTKLKDGRVEIPEEFHKLLEEATFTNSVKFKVDRLEIDMLTKVLCDMKLQCIDLSRSEGIFTWEKNATLYFYMSISGDIFSSKNLEVNYRIGGKSEKACLRLSKEFLEILEDLYGDPAQIIDKKKINVEEYDVALSFAGEERDYARQVAEIIQAKGLKVFYDEFYESQLWGKDLATYLREIYANKAHFCIMFVSKSYITKAWPSHERKSAIEKQISSAQEEYILPVRFDDSEIPGFSSTIKFLDARQINAEEVAKHFLDKYQHIA